ncbi:OBAP family protein [Skermanella stibiiresistens]|nr:OBAP family protein [Skermanella stibiiresistens]
MTQRNPGPTALALTAALAATACTSAVTSPVSPPGQAETTKTNVLEAGAAALQTSAPLSGMDIHLVGFHPMKDDPTHQMEAHHFCRQVNEDFAQCSLFDGNTAAANLTGVEYIISERLFDQLPAHERQYWHPHNGEILSGQLTAPNIPAVAEKELMRTKMNSYGKTWHTWQSEHGTEPGDTLPLGAPKLAWSFNRDGEAQPGLVEARDRAFGVSTDEIRQDRQDLLPLAHPQSGVDALKGKFPGRTQPIPGVVDKTAASR